MSLLSTAVHSSDPVFWKGDTKTAISLSYDDALNSQLDYAVPALDKYGFQASFYLTLSSPVVTSRKEEWKALVEQGHELGNHTIRHPCRASLTGRDWVAPEQDLDKISVNEMVEEVKQANTILANLDGKSQRTFAPPCGDQLAMGENYIREVTPFFLAIRGQEARHVDTTFMVPNDMSGKALVEFVKNNTRKNNLIHIIFHGVGGDHLAVSEAAHEELLEFLHKNPETYWVDTYKNIANHLSAFTNEVQ